MLSSVKNYVAVSEHVAEDLDGSEENRDESSNVIYRESLLTNDAPLSDDEQAQNAQVQLICSEVSKLPLDTDHEEAVQEDCEETSDNTVVEKELDHNKIIRDKTDEGAVVSTEVLDSSIDSGAFPRGKTSQECPVSSDSSENLLGSNKQRERSVEGSDEVFPLVTQKANSADDLHDKNFVKWPNTGNSHRNNRDKDSAQSSESPSSDVEFSACSSVTSCTEDSGISSTVRDEELEEIPLNQFSPELYKQQMSRFSLDDSVAAWIPKSSNTYAPSPNSKVASVTDSGKSQKPSKLK